MGDKETIVLSQALHHLKRFASNYYSSRVDEVVIELRHLIEDQKRQIEVQIEVEILSFEPMKWEYKQYRYAENLNFHQVIDQMGLEGWELVAVEKHHAFFKRPKAKEAVDNKPAKPDGMPAGKHICDGPGIWSTLQYDDCHDDDCHGDPYHFIEDEKTVKQQVFFCPLCGEEF